eukprot:2059076-Rhodomonas_salina.2
MVQRRRKGVRGLGRVRFLICLCSRYTMPGTDLAHGATRFGSLSEGRELYLAMGVLRHVRTVLLVWYYNTVSATESSVLTWRVVLLGRHSLAVELVTQVAICLSSCYAISGTISAYSPMRSLRHVWYEISVLSYALAETCPVLTRRTVRCPSQALSGTETAYRRVLPG